MGILHFNKCCGASGDIGRRMISSCTMHEGKNKPTITEFSSVGDNKGYFHSILCSLHNPPIQWSFAKVLNRCCINLLWAPFFKLD